MNTQGIRTLGPRNIHFRSRVEAQWAYIFDFFKWNWEYEPVDLKGYIPDFIITFGNDELLVEIKGENNIWEHYHTHAEKVIESGWKNKFCILGSQWKYHSIFSSDTRCWVNIGKIFANGMQDDLVIRQHNTPTSISWSLGGAVTYDIFSDDWKQSSMNNFPELWTIVKNKVQWKGESRETKYDLFYGYILKTNTKILEHENTFNTKIQKRMIQEKLISDDTIHESTLNVQKKNSLTESDSCTILDRDTVKCINKSMMCEPQNSEPYNDIKFIRESLLDNDNKIGKQSVITDDKKISKQPMVNDDITHATMINDNVDVRKQRNSGTICTNAAWTMKQKILFNLKLVTNSFLYAICVWFLFHSNALGNFVRLSMFQKYLIAFVCMLWCQKITRTAN